MHEPTFASPWPYPLWVAHRGAGRLAPENTLAAFRVGAAHGYRAFECDVQLSADGVPFLMHDETLVRTAGQPGRACDRPWADLALLDAGAWHSAAFAGEPVPSLAAVATAAAAQGWALNLELKPSAGEARRVGQGVVRWLAAHWRGALPPVLSSFEPDALDAARATLAAEPGAPPCPLALLLPHWQGDAPARAMALGAGAVVCHHRSLDGPAIRALHAAGLRAWSYTANDGDEALRLVAAGVDGLITDAVDRLGPGA